MWTGSRGRRSGFVLAAVLMISVVLIAATTGFAWFARNQLRRVEGERAALQSRNLAFLTAFFVARGLTADQGEYDALVKAMGDYLDSRQNLLMKEYNRDVELLAVRSLSGDFQDRYINASVMENI